MRAPEGGPLRMGSAASEEEVPESPCPLLHVRAQQGDAIREPGSGSSPDMESSSTLRDVQPPG